MASSTKFNLGKKLPKVYEAVLALVDESPNIGTNINNANGRIINSYANSLIEQWTKAFGSSYVMTLRAVKMKLLNFLKSYHKATHKTPHTSHGKKPQRLLKREWIENNGTFCLISYPSMVLIILINWKMNTGSSMSSRNLNRALDTYLV